MENYGKIYCFTRSNEIIYILFKIQSFHGIKTN